MTFQPGIASNPAGRPKGARNRRTQEILDLIQGRGDKDPLDALSEIITTNQDPNIVATAANMLLGTEVFPLPVHHRSKEHIIDCPDSGHRLDLSDRLRCMNTISYRHRWIAHNRSEEIHRFYVGVVETSALLRHAIDYYVSLEVFALYSNWLAGGSSDWANAELTFVPLTELFRAGSWSKAG